MNNARHTKPDVSFAQRITRGITHFLDKLMPPGYEDAMGFHYGSPQPTKRRTHVRARVVKTIRQTHRTKTKVGNARCCSRRVSTSTLS